jgi:hypothetical protein
MEMGDVEEEVLFVNALQVEEVDSDEELEAEIMRTEAAIDDCFRRRVIRAGIDVGEKDGRCVSEKERDRLSEKIGDRIRVRAKRRRNRRDE